MLNDGGIIFVLDIRERVCATLATDQQRVTLGEVARVLSRWRYTHQTSVAVFTEPCTDAFGDNGAFGVLTHVDHFCACIGLLAIICQGD